MLLRTLGQGEHAVFLVGPLAPGLQADEGDTRALAAAGEAEAGHGKDGTNDVALLFQQIAAHGVDALLGALGGRARRSHYLGEQDALVLFRQEGAGNAVEQHHHHADDQHIQQQERCLALEHGPHAALVAIHAAIEGAIEPAEESALLVVIILVDRLEQRRTQRRREDQRHQHREHHRRNDGDGELPIDDPGRASEEGHRQQYRRQHHANADQRALDLAHGLARRLQRREPFFAHHPFDVLHHHDGIVDQQADGQNHGEHGQGIDAETEHRQHAEGTQQHHRHRERRNQRRAEVLQEQVHH